MVNPANTPVNPQPLLIVVTGRPGSGKTTLAHQLARAIRCPAVCRDELKEGLVNTVGQAVQPGDDLNRKTYGVYIDAVRLLLTGGITLVAEAAFQHRLWTGPLEEMRMIARVRIVLCTVDPLLARVRHIQRGLADPARERFHDDKVVQAAREGREMPITEYEPPSLDVPILSVDTTDGLRPALDDIVAFAIGPNL